MLGNPLIANGPSIYSWTVMNLPPKDEKFFYLFKRHARIRAARFKRFGYRSLWSRL